MWSDSHGISSNNTARNRFPVSHPRGTTRLRFSIDTHTANILLTQSYVILTERPLLPGLVLASLETAFSSYSICTAKWKMQLISTARYFCLLMPVVTAIEAERKPENNPFEIQAMRFTPFLCAAKDDGASRASSLYIPIFMHKADKRSRCHFDCKVRKDSGPMPGIWDTNTRTHHPPTTRGGKQENRFPALCLFTALPGGVAEKARSCLAVPIAGNSIGNRGKRDGSACSTPELWLAVWAGRDR